MNEFNILLIDDDVEQERQLNEAILNFNKKYFINKSSQILGIDDEKQIAELSILDNKEEVYNKLKEDYNLNCELDEIFNFSVRYKAADTPEKAMVLLFKENFHALIVDLKLESEDNNKEDENYSGNILLKNIVNKEIIPIIVRTGFPNKTIQGISRNIIKICAKETPAIEEVIEELLDYYNTSIFSVFGSSGKVYNHIKDFFWNVLPTCFINKKEELNGLDKEIQEKVIIRYVSSWLNNKYMFDNGYLDVEPIEMYMFPNPIDKICNCDIYKDNDSNEKFIVLTPACDLANDKAENILFAKIQSYENIDEFNETIQKCYENQKTEGEISNKNRKKIALWSRNSHEKSMRYHFLPKVGFFEGGFIDFSLLAYLKYDRAKNEFSERKLVKLGTITDSFKSDIIARFSSYYQRQGQPTFNTDSILKNYL
ncbi:hypothetical protein [Veillonella sp. VA139]|uniref:hypothetical protein n=1 Tax=Veillonella sp. VA139 TaxID=741830 RepID=UPI000F8D2604|nr:hypothetical protein [Veillonella sp. VA139]